MTPWWLSLGPQFLLLACLGLLVVTVVALSIRAGLTRERGEQVRRSVLDRLELAVSRNLPLRPALSALCQDLEQRRERKLGKRWALALSLVSPVPENLARYLVRRRLTRERELIADIDAGLREGDLEEALRAGGDAFPSPLPQLIGAAQRNGTLLETLADLRELDRTRASFRASLRGKLIYPLVILVTVETLLQLYLAFVYQRLFQVFAAHGVSMDAKFYASLAMALSIMVPVFIALLWALGGLGSRRPRAQADLFSRLPLLGRAERAEREGLFAGQLAAALRAGLDLPSALRAVNTAAIGDIEPALRRADEGAPPAEALAALADPGLAECQARLAALPDDAAGALALVRDAARERQRRLLSLVAQATAPLALVSIGLLVVTHYALPFLGYQELVRELLW